MPERRQFLKILESSPEFAVYGLRSQFFARKLHEMSFLSVAQEVRRLLPLKDSFKWDQRTSLGIDPDVFERVVGQRIQPLLFFVHPRAVSEQPSLLLYYRCVAMVSQKGLARIAGSSVAAMKSGKTEKVDQETLSRVVITLNKLLSLVARTFLELEPLKEDHLTAFLYAEAGSQIQGSWNNAVGEQGELAVREIIARELQRHLLQVVWKDDSSTDAAQLVQGELFRRLNRIKILRFRRGYHCVFGSEPDVSLRDSDNSPLLSVEVKAGSDPAGALERYGAAKKSFDHEEGLNPGLKKVYVAACLTDEVQRRLTQENPFSHTFLLGELLAERDTQKRFANLFVREMTPPT